MARAIDKEKSKVKDQVDNFKLLLEIIDKRRYKTPHLEDLRQIIDYCRNTLTADLNKRLRLITRNIKAEEQSVVLSEFRYRIKRLCEVIYDCLINSFEVSRELFFLSDTFLEHHEVNPRYIICISDEIALLPLRHILQELGFNEWYPEFWEKIRKKEFYFVKITSALKDRSSSLDWPIVLHELAHIVCYEKGIDDRYFGSISIFEALKIIDALYDGKLLPDSPGVKLATKKLYITEYVADLLVTRCYGPFYGWRFVKRWFDLRDIFEPDRTHPSPDKRIEKISFEVREELQMPNCALFLEKEFQDSVGEFLTEIKEASRLDEAILKDVDAALSSIIGEVRSNSRSVLTCEEIKQSIQRSRWFQVIKEEEVQTQLTTANFWGFTEKLQKDLLEGKPIIVDPPTLYFLLTLDFRHPEKLAEIDADTYDARLKRELIADSIRLYAIQYRFLSSK